jgi:hypothetical protein
MNILKFFFLCLGFQKNILKISTYYILKSNLLYITFLGEKWFAYNVLSPMQ